MTQSRFSLPLEISIAPLEIPNIPQEHRREAENKAREAYIMTLLKYYHISAGKVASLLQIDRWQPGELMSLYNLSPFPEQTKEERETEISETLRPFKL